MKIRRLLFWLGLLLALVALLAPAQALFDAKIWVASWLPFAAQIDTFDAVRNVDKWVHLGIFAVLCGLGSRAWRPAPWRRLIVGLLCIAILTECLQHHVPGRSASFADLLADLAGLVLAMLMVRVADRLTQ